MARVGPARLKKGGEEVTVHPPSSQPHFCVKGKRRKGALELAGDGTRLRPLNQHTKARNHQKGGRRRCSPRGFLSPNKSITFTGKELGARRGRILSGIRLGEMGRVKGGRFIAFGGEKKREEREIEFVPSETEKEGGDVGAALGSEKCRGTLLLLSRGRGLKERTVGWLGISLANRGGSGGLGAWSRRCSRKTGRGAQEVLGAAPGGGRLLSFETKGCCCVMLSWGRK